MTKSHQSIYARLHEALQHLGRMTATETIPSSIARRTRSSYTKQAAPQEPLQNEAPDIEDLMGAGKRRRGATRKPRQPSPAVFKIETDTVAPAIGDVKPRKTSLSRRPTKKSESVAVSAPENWAEMYAVVKEMRSSGAARNAPVDSMGCERIAEPGVSPRIRRYHTLTALMLSSQTKDAVNAAAMNRLYTELPPHKEGAPGGLTVDNILAVDAPRLNELIWAVGFHNNKTKYIKAVAEILRDQWNSDIPDTIEGLVSLPGVGPKMAYLCLSSAWGRTEGIGVDVHVHRITNLWGWQQSKTPEDTRRALESWLPRELWHEINWLLVGFGQMICLPVGRKCGQCDLGLKGLCPAAEKGNADKKIKRVKAEKVSEGDVEVVVKRTSTRIKKEDGDN
ncbi:hypothetical protein K3495_g73 [Podosphaera aphanis]|nr:hypothetical protein K3495_g73 [Podosphaera aphanis]